MNTFPSAQVTVTDGNGKKIEVHCRALAIDVKRPFAGMNMMEPSEEYPPQAVSHDIVMTAHNFGFNYPDGKPGEEWYTGDGLYRVLYRPTWKNKRAPYIVQRKLSCGCGYATVARCWSLDRVHVFIRNQSPVAKIYSLEG